MKSKELNSVSKWKNNGIAGKQIHLYKQILNSMHVLTKDLGGVPYNNQGTFDNHQIITGKQS